VTDKDFTEGDEAAGTPRVCAACGGRGCRWCSRGYQDGEQQKAWASFRSRMRKISSTYSLLEKVVREMIDGLDAIGEAELAAAGKECLEAWITAEPDTPERREASMMVSVFQSKAVIALMKARSSPP
jgi:hypothetical protein